MTTVFPTGEQYEINNGAHTAVVCQVGATLRAYNVAGHDVVRGFGVDEAVHGARGQQLLPWPNRIRDGRYLFDGVAQELPLTEPATHNAIHGLVRYLDWTVVERTSCSITQQVTVRPQPGWPWTLQATIGHRVDDDGLTVEVTAVNASDTPCPFGYAAHPYLTVGEDTIDDVEMLLPASSWLEVDDRLLPVALHPVDEVHDLRERATLAGRSFDTAFTDLARDRDGRWRVKLRRGERCATLWADESFGWIQVFTGRERRDLSVAVEPMTCGPDAFNPGPTEQGALVLAPGGRFSGQWGISGR